MGHLGQQHRGDGDDVHHLVVEVNKPIDIVVGELNGSAGKRVDLDVEHFAFGGQLKDIGDELGVHAGIDELLLDLGGHTLAEDLQNGQELALRGKPEALGLVEAQRFDERLPGNVVVLEVELDLDLDLLKKNSGGGLYPIGDLGAILKRDGKVDAEFVVEDGVYLT